MDTTKEAVERVKRALPRGSSRFAQAFVNAYDRQDHHRILSMPGDRLHELMQDTYLAGVDDEA